MRLPWPFQRARQESPTPAASEVFGAGGASSRDLAPAAWRELPPLAETIGPPPLIAPSRPFAAALAADNPPPPILAPLSHGRGLEAPQGIIVGLARATSSVPGSASARPVQRAPSR